MKKFHTTKLLLSVTMLLVFAISLTACSLLPYYQDIKSIEIDGVNYVTGFYDDLHELFPYMEEETKLMCQDRHNWWKYEGDAPFEFYYAEHVDAAAWNPTIYCREDQFEQVKSYYQELSNFNYFIAKRFHDDTRIAMTGDICQTLEVVVQEIIADINLQVFNRAETVEIHRDDMQDTTHNLAVYRQSKDELFCTTKLECLVANDTFYLLERFDGSDNCYTLYTFDSQISDRLVTLFKDNGFLED